MLFSYRKGLKNLRDHIQTDSIDKKTRNLLWSALCESYWNSVETRHVAVIGDTGTFFNEESNQKFFRFFRHYWLYYLEQAIDEFPDDWRQFRNNMRENFFSCDWNELFDYLELIVAKIE